MNTLLIGALISLGSTGIMASLLSGLVLFYMRPFRVGNRVTIGDTSGVLLERTFLVSRIRTPQNLIVTIANSTILSSQIVNYSAPEEPVRLRTQITIGYNTSWRQVEALLLQAASRTSGILTEPAAFVHIAALEDFYVRYALNVHTKGAFYEAFTPNRARALVRRIEFCYTPKHGSWLNIAENELSSLTRQCVSDRRFEDIKTLREETKAWSDDVNATQRGVDWQMKITDARTKLKSVYPTI